MTTMRAACYARVSSQTQREKHTIESQLRVLSAYVASQGWTLVETYIDDGRSARAGKLENREGFARLVADADAKRFDVVVVVDIDRLTRTNDIEERARILGPFQRNGISIVTPSSGALDLRTMLGEFWVTMQALFAAEENAKRARRASEGQLTAAARGRKPSGPTPFGYRYDRSSGTWSVEEDEAAIVREVFERSRDGESAARLADDLAARGAPYPRDGWRRDRIFALLHQTAYRGEWVARRELGLRIATPRIVSDELWRSARDRDAAEARQRSGLRQTRRTYLLEAVAVCGLCGAPIFIASASPARHTPSRYMCRRRRWADRGGRCALPYFKTVEADDRVWGALRALVVTPERLERAVRAARDEASSAGAAWKEDLAAAERRLAALDRAEAAILARFRRGAISDSAMDIELAAARRERALAECQVDAAQRARAAAARGVDRADSIDAAIAALRSRVDASTVEQRRELAMSLLGPGGAVVGPDRIDLAVNVPLGAPTSSPLAIGSSWRTQHETTLQIRLVA